MEDGREQPTNYAKADTGYIPPETMIKIYSGDRRYIEEVIDGGRDVLKGVVEHLYPDDHLKHLPVRSYFRIVNICIILLKVSIFCVRAVTFADSSQTFALGATENDAGVTLGLLEKTIEALRSSIVDDVHVANRFSDMLEVLTKRVRERLVRLAPNGTASRGVSRSTTAAHSRQASPALPQQPFDINNGFSAANSNFMPYHQQSLQTNNLTTSTQNHNNVDRATPSHLSGITDEAYDPDSLGNITVMPPPGFNDYGELDGNGLPTGSGAQQYNNTDDWLTLPLNGLLEYGNNEVTQTAYGPDVGGYDMLDVLLLNNMAGGG